jgi:predicted ATPase/class 3 adenylate cyclase
VPEPVATTFLFTDLEGSTRLWEDAPERMRPALARHDALARAAVERHGGTVVKMTGDGVHAAFADPVDAVSASVAFQLELREVEAAHGVPLRVRCGMHLGTDEYRDRDFFGTAVNRAARIMGAAHGGQVLLSQAVAERVARRLGGDLALRDLGAVRLRDLASPERVFQVLHPQLRADFPALRSLEATPNNLPQQLTSFIGREDVLARARAMLAGTRLLTIVGTGGLGKTRLSLQLAADVLDDFPDGAWFVELAPLRDGALVPHAVASVLGVKEDPGKPVMDALTAFSRDRRMLLVLDNCEHLLAACADLAQTLLQSGPAAKVLATSREVLHVRGEASLPIPALDATHAARLFVERASAIAPSFAADAGNAPAIAEICHRLDGIPLALELAAARVRVLRVDDIAARLSERFTLLKSRDSTTLPRQHTLRALIDWSYDLLDEDERALFRRLAVFAGSFALDAAEAVDPHANFAADDVLDLLARLVEKSLVVHDAPSGRYHLLETVRQYAQERLDASPDGDDARTRHLVYYVELAERARPELFGPHQTKWLARLDQERENLLAAHANASRVAGGASLGLRLVSGLRFYWINRGLLRLGVRVTQEALARPGAQARDAARSLALFDAGQISIWAGAYAEGRPLLEESLAISRELDDRPRIAAALQPLSIAARGEGDNAMALRYAEEAVALARGQADRHSLAAALNGLAQAHRLSGNLAAADDLYGQMLDLSRAVGNPETIAIGLLNRAIVAIERGKLESASAMLGEVLAIVDETGSQPVGQSLLEIAAGLVAAQARCERAAWLYGAAQANAERTGIGRDPADEDFLNTQLAPAREALGAQGFAAAEEAGHAADYAAAIEEARGLLRPVSC